MKVKNLIWDEIEHDQEEPIKLYPETTRLTFLEEQELDERYGVPE